MGKKLTNKQIVEALNELTGCTFTHSKGIFSCSHFMFTVYNKESPIEEFIRKDAMKAHSTRRGNARPEKG